MTNEFGFTVCSNGKITKGPTVTGDSHSVVIPMVCPAGSKVIGLHHSHPGGSLELSKRDIRTAREKGIPFVCVRARKRVKCYRIR